MAALSIPVKEIAEAVMSQNPSMLSRRKSLTMSNATVEHPESRTARYHEIDSSKMPNAQVNQDKLKVILQQLKKIDRGSVRTSRW